MATTIVIQGDNLGYDFKNADGSIFDDNWYGKWAIMPGLGKPPTMEYDLERSADDLTFMFRLTPTLSTQLPVGSYVLVIEMSNDLLEYNQELLQEPLKIAKQGIPRP